MPVAMTSTGNWTIPLRKLTNQSHDHCSNCGSALPSGVAAYSGFGLDRKPLYVGECCSFLLGELVSHIYWWWTTYKRPTNPTMLWRYMDFAKFVAILKDQVLYFPRADNLGDSFEGARGLAARQQEWRQYCINWFKNAVVTAPRGPGLPIPSPDEIERQAITLYEDFAAGGERELKSTYVSCWHANIVESEAQWRLYAPPMTSGIALRTTYGRLDGSLHDGYDVRAGHVQYLDFTQGFAGTYDRIFWKRSSLSHESEVRMVLANNPTNVPTPAGIGIPVNVATAFDAVIISPFAPHWLQGVVEATVQRFGFNLPVVRSTLLEQPFF